MGIYDADIKGAQQQIKQAGQLVTWDKDVTGTPDPSKPWNTKKASDNQYSVYIVFLSPRSNGLLNVFQLLKGTDVTIGGFRGLMGAVSFTPEITDKVIRDGQVLSIDSIDIVAPNGQPILYKINFSS